MKPQKRSRHLHNGGKDFSVATTGLTPNMSLVAESMKKDTPADLQWFRQNPETRVRHRGPTVLEMFAFSIPSTTQVVVKLDSNGKTWRYFVASPQDGKDHS